MIKTLKQFFVLSLSLGIALTFSFCGNNKKTGDSEKTTTVTHNSLDSLGYLSAESINNIIEEIKKKFNDDTKFEDIQLLPQEVALAVLIREPNDKKNITRYSYGNKTWSRPFKQALEDTNQSFSLKDVDMSKIPDLVIEAEKRIKNLKGKHKIIDAGVNTFGGRLRIYFNILNCDTNQYNLLEADAKGVVYNFE